MWLLMVCCLWQTRIEGWNLHNSSAIHLLQEIMCSVSLSSVISQSTYVIIMIASDVFCFIFSYRKSRSGPRNMYIFTNLNFFEMRWLYENMRDPCISCGYIRSLIIAIYLFPRVRTAADSILWNMTRNLKKRYIKN